MREPDALGESLRALRVARGIGLAQAAARAGIAKSSLLAWETDRSRPRGPALGRLLDALGAEPRLRARLLQAADPAHARIELAHSPWGAPVDLGVALRAMRERRGTTQADLARRLGVAQGTVARWESGDARPNGETLQAIGFLLGTAPEETFALTCVQGTEPAAIPADPGEAHRFLSGRAVPEPLREIFLLGAEAELWRRAVRDPRWDALLCDTLGARANLLFHQGRLDEVGPVADRALRMAAIRSPFAAATAVAACPSFGALASLARWRGDDPRDLAGPLQAWTARLPDSANRAWMMWILALRLGALGETSRALELTERAVGMHGERVGEAAERVRAVWTAEVLLEARLPRRAAAQFAAPPDDPETAATYVRAEHACGRPVADATMAALAAAPGWYAAQRRARLERAQLRLRPQRAPYDRLGRDAPQ